MKLLANIFLSGLAILACVSCSKDEDPVLSLEGAKLSVAVKASGTATKAYNPNDVNELEGEAYINNLAVVVFNETGTELLGYKWEALSGAELPTALERSRSIFPWYARMVRLIVLSLSKMMG